MHYPFWILGLVYISQFEVFVLGCLRGASSNIDRASKSLADHSSHSDYQVTELAKVRSLNRADEIVSFTNFRARQGTNYYGRIIVPWEKEGWSITLRSMWDEKHFTTPMWVFVRRAGLPKKTHWDKTSISFISRQYSQIILDNIQAGAYWVLFEPLVPMLNVTVAISILPDEKDMQSADFFQRGVSVKRLP